MKIVVMCGGLSMERDVSISSGTLICGALRKLGHQAVLVDMFMGLEDYEGDLNDLVRESSTFEGSARSGGGAGS